MNIYDLILLMWVTILTSVFIYFVIDMLGRTRKLYNTVINLKSYNEVWVDPQLKNIRQLVTDEIINKKEDVTKMEVTYCIDCKHSRCWRSGEAAQKYGKGLECSLHIIASPDDYDFCSKGETLIKCKSCGRRFDHDLPNFCPNCGAKMESEEVESCK